MALCYSRAHRVADVPIHRPATKMNLSPEISDIKHSRQHLFEFSSFEIFMDWMSWIILTISCSAIGLHLESRLQRIMHFRCYKFFRVHPNRMNKSQVFQYVSPNRRNTIIKNVQVSLRTYKMNRMSKVQLNEERFKKDSC